MGIVAKTKEEYVSLLKEKLSTDIVWATRGLCVIYSHQTLDEQECADVKVNNGIGFTSLDADFLTSLYNSYHKYGRLSEKQGQFLMRKMPKYARQLFNYSLSIGNVAKIDGYYQNVKKSTIKYK